MTKRDLGWAFLGLALGLGGASAVSMVVTGYRVDEEGTGPWEPETAIQLAGAGIGAVLLLVGLVLMSAPRPREVR